MKSIRVKDEEWARAGVYYVRTEAMVEGFGVSLAGEFSEDTKESEFILVTDDDGRPLSTARIRLIPEKGFAKIERVATVSYARGKGAGRLAVEAAEDWIRERGYGKIVITSRDEAVGFYEKLGYTADYSVDARALFPLKEKKPDETPGGETRKPRFVVVYMEKLLGGKNERS